MEEKKEGLEPHKTPETVVLPAEVTISQVELDDFKHKAEVSSQNFERLKKAEQEVEELRVKLSEINPLPVEYEDEVIGKLKNDVSDLKQKLGKSEVLEAYPILKDVWNEFDSFRNEPDNKGMNMKTAAKAFVTEKGLLEPTRKGLEKPTGGGHTPVSSGMSNDEVKKLRETDWRKYQELLKKGDIKIS